MTFTRTHEFPAGGPWLRGGAELSADERHRFRLWRHWTAGQGPHGVFVMLNPSWAEERHDDATMRRVIGFAKREGWAGVEVVNLFSLRSADPAALWRAPEMRQADDERFAAHNRETLLDVCAAYGDVVIAWGAVADRFPDVAAGAIMALRQLGRPLYAFEGATKSGQPLHPLRLARTRPIVRWPS
jgi:hypothetical protein